VFGVEERPVAKGDVPGEWYSPTQPFPLKPPPLARTSMKREDLVTAADTTPEHAQACRELWEKNGLYNDGPFTPWAFHEEGGPAKVTVSFPGATGGASWGGMASDPKSGLVFLQTHDQPLLGWVEKKQPGRRYENGNLAYDRYTPPGVALSAAVKDADGKSLGNWPCQKPPWARMIAVNANTGDIAWSVPLGTTPTLPEGKRITGATASGGPMVTASGLVFMGAATDARFRAFDSKTGRELWAGKVDRTASAIPVSYQAKNGKQYVAITATDTLVAFTLPNLSPPVSNKVRFRTKSGVDQVWSRIVHAGEEFR
jgi:quinoprotein glucose dehydrogenase